MANVSRPAGFRPLGEVIRIGSYLAGGTIYPGDLVNLDSDGKVTVAAASAALLGAALTYATSGQEVQVADSPNQMYLAESDDSTIDAQTDINLNYNFVAATANTDFKVSRHVIDGNTGVTDSNIPIKVINIVPRVDNALGANVKCVCKINNHQLSGGTGTLGV